MKSRTRKRSKKQRIMAHAREALQRRQELITSDHNDEAGQHQKPPTIEAKKEKKVIVSGPSDSVTGEVKRKQTQKQWMVPTKEVPKIKQDLMNPDLGDVTGQAQQKPTSEGKQELSTHPSNNEAGKISKRKPTKHQRMAHAREALRIKQELSDSHQFCYWASATTTCRRSGKRETGAQFQFRS